MLSEFEKTIAAFIAENDLVGSAGKIVLAVSGGADSVSLLHTAWALKAAGVLKAQLVCAHINHQLRGAQADKDEQFVAAQAVKLNLAVVTRKVDVRRFARERKLSIETAGRQLRIEILSDIAAEEGCGLVATGHHKDDNAETIIQRLVRGTGFRGLCGIRPKQLFAENLAFIRPLLCVTRAQIVDYLRRRNLEWREDATNADCTFRRNFIRHCLLPQLQQQSSGSLAEQIFELSRASQRLRLYIVECADKLWGRMARQTDDTVTVNIEAFRSQPEFVRVELVRRSLVALGCGERDLTREHFHSIVQLAQKGISGKRVVLPGGYEVARGYQGISFERTTQSRPSSKQKVWTVNLKVPGRTMFGERLIEATVLDYDSGAFERFKAEKDESIEWFDLDMLRWPMKARVRLIGDRFHPLGYPDKKRVGKFLTSAKTPRELRENVIVVADNEKIIWVWPVRISEQAKITAETRKILQLRITRLGKSGSGASAAIVGN